MADASTPTDAEREDQAVDDRQGSDGSGAGYGNNAEEDVAADPGPSDRSPDEL